MGHRIRVKHILGFDAFQVESNLTLIVGAFWMLGEAEGHYHLKLSDLLPAKIQELTYPVNVHWLLK